MGEARIWVGSALKQLRAALSSALYSANRGRGLLGRLGSYQPREMLHQSQIVLNSSQRSLKVSE